jgi:hypothetical protein
MTRSCFILAAGFTLVIVELLAQYTRWSFN